MQQTIDNYNFSGKKAIIRVDFNVPLNAEFQVTDETRIKAAIPTIKKVLEGGGSAILMSHLGRPKGVTEKFSLKHIIYKVEELLGVSVKFVDDAMQGSEAAAALQSGEVLLLENLRFYAEEEGKPRGLAEDATDEDKKAAKAAVKESQKGFVKTLASYADCYINDAFGTAHRSHGSTALIAAYFPNDKMFGYIMENEIKAVDNLMKNGEHPVTAIVGGSKVSSKITIIENLLPKVDNLIIGGGMTYTFFAAQGGKIGSSINEPDMYDTALTILKKADELGVKIHFADDDLIADKFANDANTQVVDGMSIPDGWQGLDVGPKTIEKFSEVIKASKTILWNGPVGVFEMPTFAKGSMGVAQAIVDATASGAFSLIGGGDSVACVNQFGFASGVSYISTGGGAMLECLEGKTLPGIAAIQE
ncbi:MAG: phosphoglycerate kinase [Rikenellaceae bacterium]